MYTVMAPWSRFPSVAQALPVFVWALFGSGSAGILYWVLPVAVLFRFGKVFKRGAIWTLGAVTLLLLQAAFTSVWLFPEYTLDQSTVHRQLLPVSVVASLWLASVLVGAVNEGDAAARC